MTFEVIRRGNQLFVRLPNRSIYSVLSFIWDYFGAGLFLGLALTTLGFSIPLAILPVFVRLELEDKPAPGAPTPGTSAPESPKASEMN